MMINPILLTFSEYLKQLPSEFIITTFLKKSGEKRWVVSSSMIEDIANKLTTAEEIKKRYYSLTPEQQVRCSWMYLIGKKGINTTNNTAVFNDPLISSFLGYAARKENKIKVFGFSSFDKYLTLEFSRTLAENSSKKFHDSIVPEYEIAYVNDVTIVLSFASKNLLVKKKCGKIVKSVLQQLKKLLHLPNFYEYSDVEIVLSAIIKYCKSKELIEELDDRYLVSQNAIYSWLKRNPQENKEEIKNFFLKETGEWNIDILLKTFELCGENWLKVPSFLLDEEKDFWSALLLLDFVNIIELKKYKNEFFFHKGLIRQFQQQMDSSIPAVIMPDFSILIREECSTPHLYTFSCVANFTSFDQIYHGKIDKESITNALANCCEKDTILSLLEKFNAPANVNMSVKEWIREFLRVSLCKNDVLIICDKKTGEQLSVCEELKPFIKEIPVTTVFVIKNGSDTIVEKTLKNLGFDIRMPRINYNENSTHFSSVNKSFPYEEVASWTPVVENEEIKEDSKAIIKGSKYSSELKKLDMTEIIQVIDYAILTSQKLIFFYGGSNYIKKGIYNVIPLRCSKGQEPILEGEIEHTGSRKQFYIKKIDSIGVI